MRPACTDATVVQAGLRTSAIVRVLIATGLPPSRPGLLTTDVIRRSGSTRARSDTV